MASSVRNMLDWDMRQILAIEQRNGLYPITISFLKLLHTLFDYAWKWHFISGETHISSAENVEYSKQWMPLTKGQAAEDGELQPVSLEDFHPCLSFIKADLFARYESWRYTLPSQKTKIALKVLTP